MGMTMFSSRPPFTENLPDGQKVHSTPTGYGVIRFRPQHNPTNPILIWFRAVLDDPKCGTREQVIDDFLIYHIKGHGQQENHARKVLCRLANLINDKEN